MQPFMGMIPVHVLLFFLLNKWYDVDNDSIISEILSLNCLLYSVVLNFTNFDYTDPNNLKIKHYIKKKITERE